MTHVLCEIRSLLDTLDESNSPILPAVKPSFILALIVQSDNSFHAQPFAFFRCESDLRSQEREQKSQPSGGGGRVGRFRRDQVSLVGFAVNQ